MPSSQATDRNQLSREELAVAETVVGQLSISDVDWPTHSGPKTARVVALVLGLLAVVGGLLWFVLHKPAPVPDPALAPPVSGPVAQPVPSPPATADPGEKQVAAAGLQTKQHHLENITFYQIIYNPLLCLLVLILFLS